MSLAMRRYSTRHRRHRRDHDPADVFGIDFNGTVTITQGDAPGDVAYLDGDAINNVSITQGDNVQAPNGPTVASDVAEINGTSVTSDISIIQGTGTSTAINAGNYVTAIGFDYLGLVNGDQASSSVTAVDTYIDQNYANNQVFLGDTDSSFTTVSWMSSPAAVVAHSSWPRTRPSSTGLCVFSPYTIDGGGSGNT